MKNIKTPIIFLTIVILSVSCSTSSTQEVIPTEIIPTNTLEPTQTQEPTQTPIPTETHTPTPTETPAVFEEFSLDIQENGSLMVSDNTYGYNFIVPGDWVVINPSVDLLEDMYAGGVELMPDSESILAEGLESLSQGGRFIVYNFDPVYFSQGFTPNILIVVAEDPQILYIPLDTIVEYNKFEMTQIFPFMEIDYSGILESTQGLQYGLLTYCVPLNEIEEGLCVNQQQVYIKIDKGFVLFTITKTGQEDVILNQIFEEIVNSIIIN